MERENSRKRRMEGVERNLKATRRHLRIIWELSDLAGIDEANVPARTRLNEMFDNLIETLETGIPDSTPQPRRRRRKPEVIELARRICRHHFSTESDPSDMTLAWIEARVVEIINDPELRQLKQDHNPRRLTARQWRELQAKCRVV